MNPLWDLLFQERHHASDLTDTLFSEDDRLGFQNKHWDEFIVGVISDDVKSILVCVLKV